MEDLEVQARKQGAAIDRLHREEEDAWFETHSAHLTSDEAEIGVLRFHGRQQAARLRSWWAIQNQGAARLHKTGRLPLLQYNNLLNKREEALQDLNKREQRLEAEVAKQLGKHAPPLTARNYVIREGDESVIHAQTTKTRKKEAARTASHARHHPHHHKKEVEPATTPVVVVREKASERAKAAETVRRDLEILQDDMRVLKWTMEDELDLLREYDPQGLLSGAEDALNMHQIDIVARLRQEEDVNDAFMRAFEMDAEEKLADVTKRERDDEGGGGETPHHRYHMPSRPEKRLTPGGGEDDLVDARISNVHPWLLQSFIGQMIKRSPTLAKANSADTARYIGNLARVGSPVVDMAVSAALEETKARELVPVYVEMIGAPTGKRGTPKSIARDRRLDDNTKRLYHQTNAAAADAIVESQQFRLGTVGYAGAGIYFATTPEDTDLKAHEKGVTIVATVRLGNVYEMTASERDTTGESLEKMGYDSVYLMRPTGPEYVVYFSDQVLEISILDRTKTTGRPRRQAATKRATIAGSVEERELITIVPESGSKPAVTVPVNQIGMLNRYDGESYHFPGAEVMFNGMHEVLFRDHGWCGRKHLLGKNSTIIDNITMDGLYNIVMSKKERKWRQYCKKGATDKTQSRWEEYNDQTKKWTPIAQAQPTLSVGDTWFLVSWC